MKKFILPLLFAGIVFTACKDIQKEEELNKDNLEMIDDHHNAELSLDINGSYSGTLPCADCPGIERNLVLKEDNTYQETSVYLDRDTEFVENGTWEIDKNVITLKETETGETQKLFAGENFVKYLDQEGNEIEGELAEYYKLKKSN